MLSDLARAIRERQAILFVGAGVSAGLGLPPWHELIQHIGQELGYEADVFIALDAGYLALAEFSDDRIKASLVHKYIVSLDFPIIYTTNYDRNIEAAFRVWQKKYIKIVDVRDIAGIRDGDTQIVKLHGDFDNDESIVLTETDYYDRLSFESPLDVKLRSDALAKAILFIGYSLTDINVRLLLHKLWRTWDASGYSQHRPKSYIFFTRPDPIQEAVLAQWDIKAITEDVDNPGDALRVFLERLHQQVA